MEILDLQLSNEKLKRYCKELTNKIPLNRKILLIRGPQLNLGSFEPTIAKNKGYYAFPPMGLQYVAAAIEGRGLEVQILDLNYEFLRLVNSEGGTDWLSILKNKLSEFNPSIIGISNLFSVDTPGFLQILNCLKGENKIIIAGGQNATYEGEKLLKQDLCHFVCARESENKINFLLDNLFEEEGSKPTPEIFFKYNGEIEQSKGEKDVVELKGNLIKTYNLIPIEKYNEVGCLSPFSRMVGTNKSFATLIFNRGCQGNCKFCGVVDFSGKEIRSRDTKDFLDELEYLIKEKNVKFFELLDDDFAANKQKAVEVLQGILDRNLDIKWASNNGMIAATLNEEVMEKMQDSGCIGFKIGVESGNPQILREIHKPGTLESFKRFSILAQKFPKMFIADNYIIGFPNETFGQIMDSYNFALEMNLDWSNFAIYQHNVSFFGNKEERKQKDNNIGDFIPTKDTKGGKLDASMGLKIFDLPRDNVPSRDQLKEIWFAFNLMRNFILNKNIKLGGDPKKYISWVRTLEERYPTHPYINLFLSLAYRLIEEKGKAEEQKEKTLNNLKDPYWNQRFKQFELNEILNKFPENKFQARYLIDRLREKYGKFN